MNVNGIEWKSRSIPSYEIRTKREQCYKLLQELYYYNAINHKVAFNFEEDVRITELIEGDILSVELARQIILERLNK